MGGRGELVESLWSGGKHGYISQLTLIILIPFSTPHDVPFPPFLYAFSLNRNFLLLFANQLLVINSFSHFRHNRRFANSRISKTSQCFDSAFRKCTHCSVSRLVVLGLLKLIQTNHNTTHLDIFLSIFTSQSRNLVGPLIQP